MEEFFLTPHKRFAGNLLKKNFTLKQQTPGTVASACSAIIEIEVIELAEMTEKACAGMPIIKTVYVIPAIAERYPDAGKAWIAGFHRDDKRKKTKRRSGGLV